jgi:hypothetical protein
MAAPEIYQQLHDFVKDNFGIDGEIASVHVLYPADPDGLMLVTAEQRIERAGDVKTWTKFEIVYS